VPLKSTPFSSRDYYTNIRKALLAEGPGAGGLLAGMMLGGMMSGGDDGGWRGAGGCD
jgi:hypothetical protein